MKGRRFLFVVLQLIILIINISCNKKENVKYSLIDYKNDIENKFCKIHNLTLEKENVPIIYGLIRLNETGKEFYKLKIKYFPHSNDPILGGCIISTEYSEEYVCGECNKVRDEYKKKLKLE